MGNAEKLQAPVAQSHQDRIIAVIEPLIAPLGYEVVYVEIQSARTKTLRLFIDRKDEVTVGIEDCIQVTRALDEPLDQCTEIDSIFKGPYELEVSSPGVDRPLRTERDYERFSGRDVRIHVYRPLTAEELGNLPYQAKNPKQKNFMGRLKGLQDGKIRLALVPGESERTGKKKPKKGKHLAEAGTEPSAEEIAIPLQLISKANIEPNFEFDSPGGEKE